MAKKSFFETRLMRSKIRSQTVSLFPEAGLGYLLGPILALFGNGIVNIWLVQYWHNVLGMGSWAPWLETVIPLVSSVIIIIGNILVGRLMERKPSLAGKARPLILLGMPLIAASFLLLFLVGVPTAAVEENILAGSVENNFTSGGGLLVSILAALGYNLFYAIAWPMYYTSHSALVNLSTRDGGKRGLLGTAVMGAQLAAAGVSGMIMPFLVDILHLLPVYTYDNQYALDHGLFDKETMKLIGNNIDKGIDKFTKVTPAFTNDFTAVKGLDASEYSITVHRADANQMWIILMIIMIAALVVGCLLEYFFTRERITEDNINNSAENTDKPLAKKVTMKEQIGICLRDKNWWFIMIFWILYQFGGMMKNNSMSFFSQAFTNGVSLSGTINAIGAIPTAVGMVFVWPLAAKFTKAKTISLGGVVALLGAGLAFLCIPLASNGAAVTGISVAAFCIKALGTAPAMYISLALMANVLDHQEAVHGVRTDGFTMAVYGSIMVAMSGICNGLIVGFNNLFDVGNHPLRFKVLETFFAYGTEGLCYLAMGIMLLFMNVEKFANVDNIAIVFDQKRLARENGVEYVDPETRNKLENEENDRYVEETRIAQLKLACEKKGLNFEEENNKFLAKKAEAEKKAEAKKEEAEAKKQAKLDALTPEQKQALEDKAAAKKALQEKKDAQALEELNKIREKINRVPVVAE